jgi:nucleotide-binding universal stress UspA family protein
MYKNVLLPLDGSALAECALEPVKKLFKLGALEGITLLKIVRVDISYAEISDLRFNFKALKEELFASARKYLAGVEARLSAEGITVKTEVLEGDRVADAIADYAREKGMDMIVIATHGYSGLKKLMFGSVAYGVLHDSYIPVLLIRPEACRK